MTQRNAVPFSRAGAIALVVVGMGVLLAMLYFIAIGDTGGPNEQNGRSHAASNGLNGYSALVKLVEADGMDVTVSRNQGALDRDGLLVLTPPRFMDPEELRGIIDRREYVGPTLVILPKWDAINYSFFSEVENDENAQKGWVLISDMDTPAWAEEEEGILALGLKRGGMPGVTANGFGNQIFGLPATGEEEKAPDITSNPQSFSTRFPLDKVTGALPTAIGYYAEPDISREPLIVDQAGRMIAFSYEAPGYYTDPEERYSDDYAASNWVVFVVEPDLVNNWGLADEARAMAALQLIRNMAWGDYEEVVFDVTLNGLGGTMNLLTLAFEPPFLAATLCLILAMVIVGWRASLRFGPSVVPARETAFGKARLVANGADLIVRAGRVQLLAEPYIALSTRRMARALALAKAEPEAIDAALAMRAPDEPSFTARTQELRVAEKPVDILRAARALNHQITIIQKKRPDGRA